jgi:dTDP-4-amino-4,6-dideoxygalactose transaminase
MYGQNSRLDSLQAVVGNRLINEANPITDSRIANAMVYDKGLADLGEYVVIPPRKPGVKQVFHTYVIQAADRDGLLNHLVGNGIEAKVHYPIPMHLQEASRYLGYKQGDFPVCERHCETILSLPVHQHLATDQLDWVIDQIHEYYSGKSDG